jgi:pyruvate dehydrogenase E2 component (dihydrolipoamide acetyltransferase)
MPYEIKLPYLGEGMAEAEIRKWLVKEGDSVAEHQSVVEVETDKAVVEVPSPRKGRVLRILKGEGEIVAAGESLMSIVEEGEVFKEIAEERGREKAGEKRRSVSVVGVLPEEEEEEKETVLATPAVRALAREKGIRLEGIKGTGPRGSITREDLLGTRDKVEVDTDEYGAVEQIPIRGVRRTIARHLLKSHQMTVCVTGMEEVDVTELWKVRKREDAEGARRGVHLTYFPFIVKECGTIIQKQYYNNRFAVDTPDGLIVPVLRNVEKKSIIELAGELEQLAERARQRTVKLQELKGSTFTISNYGQFGGGFSTPIINYPDVAILGCGRISDRPWVVDGEIAIRKILPLSLTFDHRVTDGGDATRFLSRVGGFLEDPALLFIESV